MVFDVFVKYLKHDDLMLVIAINVFYYEFNYESNHWHFFRLALMNGGLRGNEVPVSVSPAPDVPPCCLQMSHWFPLESSP